jgi:hypothetical protein
MLYKDFKYRCLECQTINTLSFEWFKNDLDAKSHSCSNCNKTRKLNVKNIRQRDYNNFMLATEIVGLNKKNSSYFLKITNPAFKNFFEIPSKIYDVKIGRSTELTFQSNSINQQQLTIPDQYVSRNHCSITIEKIGSKTQLILNDEKSMNGTYCNGLKLDEYDQVILKPSDIIKLGETTIEICI